MPCRFSSAVSVQRHPKSGANAPVVEVKEKQAFDGPLVLRVDGHDRTLGSTVANQVFVQKSPVSGSSVSKEPSAQ